ESKFKLESHEMRSDSKGSTTISAQMLVDGKPRTLTGEGNGPIDAFVHALRNEFKVVFDVKDYVEHALSQGSEAMAVAYIEGADAEGNVRWGVGTDPSTITASLRAVLCAFERQGVTR
ncbi:MAG: alpha-isopropylmalate synthase regulatory domain-containing protein, partial [Ilumatobacteraceae bacterium]